MVCKNVNILVTLTEWHLDIFIEADKRNLVHAGTLLQKVFCNHFPLKFWYSWKVNKCYLHIFRFLYIYHISFWILGFWSYPYCFESSASLTALSPSELFVFFPSPLLTRSRIILIFQSLITVTLDWHFSVLASVKVTGLFPYSVFIYSFWYLRSINNIKPGWLRQHQHKIYNVTQFSCWQVHFII